MRAGGAGGKDGVEVELKARIQDEVVLGDAGDVDSVVTFGVHLPEGVFVEEVIADHQAPFIRAELDVVRPGLWPQIQHGQEPRLVCI